MLWVYFFQSNEMPCSIESRQVNICNATNFYIVERQDTLNVGDPTTLLKICLTQIGRSVIYPYTQIGTSTRTRKFDKGIFHVGHTFFKLFQRRARTTN